MLLTAGFSLITFVKIYIKMKNDNLKFKNSKKAERTKKIIKMFFRYRGKIFTFSYVILLLNF